MSIAETNRDCTEGVPEETAAKPLRSTRWRNLNHVKLLSLPLLLSAGIIAGVYLQGKALALEGPSISEAVKESTVCAQVITKAKNYKTGEIRYFPDTCFDRNVWEVLPPDSVTEPTTYKIFIPSVSRNDDYPRVGPRPLPW